MTRERGDYQDRITANPEVMVGKPVIKGTRIPVERLIAHLAHNTDLADLFGAYPELTLEDVKASLQYAHTAVGAKGRRARHRAGTGPRSAQV